MRIGFFGGSFDPPHLGHLEVGRAAADAFSLDRLLFAPTACQPLKPDGPSVSFDDRLNMVALLCESHAGSDRMLFEPSSLDAPREDNSPNYTVDALAILRDDLSPEDRLFALVGADAFLGLPRWKSPETLLDLAEWIVVSRPGVSVQPGQDLPLTAGQWSRVHLLEGVQESASSTRIRKLLMTGSECSGLLPVSILSYIRARHLYGT